MNAYGMILTIVVLLGVAAAILLFERRRAERINDDLRDMARKRRQTRGPDLDG